MLWKGGAHAAKNKCRRRNKVLHLETNKSSFMPRGCSMQSGSPEATPGPANVHPVPNIYSDIDTQRDTNFGAKS